MYKHYYKMKDRRFTCKAKQKRTKRNKNSILNIGVTKMHSETGFIGQIYMYFPFNIDARISQAIDYMEIRPNR